jgi:CheY-like chemotaxis protein
MNGSPNSPASRGLILVVEDDIQLSRLFVEVLTDAGYEVVPADSVTDALSTLSYQRVDAAVLDIELRDGPVFPVADTLAALGTPFLFPDGAPAAPGNPLRGQAIQHRGTGGAG